MRSKEKNLLGVRVPALLKKKLSSYCVINGIKISYFVSEAIKEKLERAKS
jgi:hypothetical protein